MVMLKRCHAHDQVAEMKEKTDLKKKNEINTIGEEIKRAMYQIFRKI